MHSILLHVHHCKLGNINHRDQKLDGTHAFSLWHDAQSVGKLAVTWLGLVVEV